MRESLSNHRPVGQQIVEVACVLVILVLVLVPVISSGVIPLRFELARRSASSLARKLSLSEKFSDAIKEVQQTSELSDALTPIGGVHLLSSSVVMSISSQQSPGKELTIDQPGRIPAGWLPDGAQAPCSYFIHLTLKTDIDPLITSTLAGQSYAGLNKPISLSIEEVAHWENLGRDPSTGEFYVNE